MSKMKIGDLIFVHSDSWIGHQIEYVTHSKYSHCAGIIKENEIIESQGLKKTEYQAIDYYTNYDIFTCPSATDEQINVAIEFAKSKLGTRYSYFLILWELVHYIFHLDIPFNERKKYICSTLWAEAYRKAGIDLCPNIRYPSPADLANSKLLVKI
jgi:uncharacterized protein YycO